MNQIQQKKLEQLTPEQESLIPIINDKWINLALDGKTDNLEEIPTGDWKNKR